jgi:16S rRNA (cytosine967-C5)-methyltransferase
VSERSRALQLLQKIEREQLYASLVLLGESGFVRTAVLGVLRWRSKLDFWIGELAGRPLKKLEPAVVDVLRLGIHELQWMDSARYAAVSETVDLAPRRARGLVNAVLRRASDGRLADPADLASRTAHPAWLLERWSRQFGIARAARIAEANQELSWPDVLALSDDIPPDAVRSTLVDGMWRLHGSSASLSRERFHPMDEGSAVIAAIARACGDRILDLAAAPGGKTIFMTHGGGDVVAHDISIGRLRALAGRHAAIVVGDGRVPPFRGTFPVVLLDAPCSATGTIRKNPEIKWRLREGDPASFAPLQRELLESALRLSSRYVVYSTCSLEREENDDVVEGFARVDITPFVPEGARPWIEDGVLRLTPESGADGFTAFVLEKQGG